MAPSITTSRPGPKVAKQPQTIVLSMLAWCSTKVLPKSLRDHQDHFCKISLCVLFRQQCFLPWSTPIFAKSLSYRCVIKTDLNWSKRGLQFFRFYSGFFVIYWMRRQCTLAVIFRPAIPGKVHYCSNFSDPDSLQSQSESIYIMHNAST